MDAVAREWWLLDKDRKPVGPVSAERLLEGIEEERVPPDTLVCEVGGSQWRAIRSVSAFEKAFAEIDGLSSSSPEAKRRHPDGPESTAIDPPTIPPEGTTERVALPKFEDVAEKTIVEDAPHWSEPPR